MGQFVGVVREARRLDQTSVAIHVGGPGAGELAVALAAGADAGGIVQVGGDPTRVTVAIRLIEAVPTDADVTVLRRITRASVPLVVVRRGPPGAPIPYVLPDCVIEAPGATVPVDQVAAALAGCLGDRGAALAAHVPSLRPAVTARIVREVALTNAVVAAAPWVRRAHLPLLTLAQARMLLRLGSARGDALPSDPRGLAAAVAPALAGAIGMGVGARALHRRLPFRGPLVGAAVAYAGTRALGEARARL